MNLRSHRLRIALALAALLAATVAAYWPGTHGAFLLDDFPNIVQNPALQDPHPGLGNIARAINQVDSGPLLRPIAMATFALNTWADGLNPWPMKITNLIIHLMNGLLVFALMRLLLRQYQRMRPDLRATTCDWTALAVTAAWLLAPVNLTSVLYIVQRMTSLAATFTLAGLLAYVTGRQYLTEDGDTRRGVLLLGLSGIVFMPLAALTKEIGMLMPVYALVIEWVFFQFRGAGGRWSRSALGYFGLFLVLPAAIGLTWLIPHLTAPAAFATRPFTMGERLLTEGRVLWHYIYWTLVPDIGSLTLYHDAFPVSHGLLSPWTTWVAWGGIAALLALGIGLRRRSPLVSFGILWFLAGQLLTATVIPLELVFEHRMYLPSLGILAILFTTLMLTAPATRLKTARQAAVACLILLYGAGLALRSLDWSNPITHMTIAAREHPDSPRATYGYGRALAILSHHEPALAPKAYKALESAMRVPGQSATAPSALIILASRLGRAVKPQWYAALEETLSVAPPNPQDISALHALVQCALRDSHACHLDPDRMERVFAAALDHRPSSHAVAALYGTYLLDVADQPQEAGIIFQRLVDDSPSDANYHYDLGVAALAVNRLATARRELSALRRLNALGMNRTKIVKLSHLIEEVAQRHAK